MSEAFRCGRRGPWAANSPFKYDQVEKGDHYRDGGTCSYCGSVSQEAFLAFIEAGGEVGPTDKSYKAYLHGTDTAQAPGIKFYFQHLDEAGMRKFIELVNAKRMRIGYPGHFYVRPYFCVPVKADAA
ncbi:hypothetical protein LMG31506_03014 [Cupriavidus yeoncheonensis]|uniref:Uncharacterized protein n=1 Tax=Cupriavidus yeoncheonensis TaxID=1462994 RepID=A0A916MY62_9BURK|nr:hypothetical protein [Cupriavidus yeoncheonensis]CAG2144476.1 hypothetical protein LMG31506_03014 [Cupriavidus yeoncheonensis]